MNYSSQDIQEISSKYRSIARRLSKTDYYQCDSNLKRFMSFVDTNALIKQFIIDHNTFKYDIESVIESRDELSPFDISAEDDKEISLEYQLLSYAVDCYDGDFTRLYNTYWYTDSDSTVNDEMRKFIEHIIDPLIDYIGDYIRICYDRALREEHEKGTLTHGTITANNSTVVVNSDIHGNVSTSNTISQEIQNDSLELVNNIKKSLQTEQVDSIEEIYEVLEQIEADIKSQKKPKKSFLTVLKNLCGGIAAVAPLITMLISNLSS